MTQALRISVVEDNANTRTLIKNYLVARKLGKVSCYKNGTPLLKQNDVLDTDIIIIGMELENSYAGSDLIRHLARLKKLQLWTKVIFVTNQSEKVRSDLPLLGQKCDVIDKPIDFRYLSKIITDSKDICFSGRQVFEQLDQTSDITLVSLVKELRMKAKGKESLDSIKLMQSKLLLKLNRPKLIFSVLESISDTPLQHLSKMHYFFYFGQQQALQEVLASTRNQGILKTKRDNFYLFQNVINRDYQTALRNIEVKREADLHPPEIFVKALLIGLTKGLPAATRYLEKKRNVSLENHYYRSAITIIILFICFLQLVTQYDTKINDTEIRALIEENLSEKSLNHPGNDFKSFVPFISLACRVVNKEFDDNPALLHVKLDELVNNTTNIEPTKRIVLFIIYMYIDEKELAFEQLRRIATLLTDVEISPEIIVNYLAYDLFIEQSFSSDNRALLLNRLGKTLFEQRFPAAALRLFYRSFKTAPDSTSNTLNLLSSLVTCHLDTYLDVNVNMLISNLDRKNLDKKHTRTLDEIKGRFSQAKSA